jgi:hypothetical protein
MRQTVANILREVAQEHGLTVASLIGHERSRHIVLPRHEAYYRAFTECPHVSYPEIARRIGGRDHTTILHGVRAHGARIGVTYEYAVRIRKSGGPGYAFYALAKDYERAMNKSRAGGPYASAA